jgi:hypothetical protein
MKIITALLTALLFIGCTSKATDTDIEPKLVVQQSLETLKLNDQNGNPHAITSNTKKVIFAFSKDVGHKCNDFFATKPATYLADNNTLFVADISSAPSLIRSMFIMPGLKDFKHIVLVLDDKNVANGYKAKQDIEKIVVVSVNNKTITDIKNITSIDALAQEIVYK